MVIKPFPDQQDLLNDVNQEWVNGHQNVLAVASTGFGKTLVKAFMAQQFMNQGKVVVIFAHRDVLLSQISLSLCKVGIPHKFVCSRKSEVEISNVQVSEFGQSFISDTATVIVASVLTWINRDTKVLAKYVDLWMMDEAHHLVEESSWHQCVEALDNKQLLLEDYEQVQQELLDSLGLGVTATPKRHDKKGLGRGHGGIFDVMVQAIPMGELIARGRLSKYRIYTTPCNIDMTGINITSSGDYNQKKLALASDKADIIGDAVEHYLRLARGEQAITFCVSIEHANHVCEQFNNAGVKSFVLSSKTPLHIRVEKEKAFRNGHITNLINVDLFGEGYDVPKCSVVIMLRKTASYGLFMQQFGRMLRVAEGKDYGILLDHVGNVPTHCVYGAPHDSPEWSLEAPKKKKSDTGKPVIARTCPKCFGYYQPVVNSPKHFICPYCGHAESDEEINTAQRELQVADGNLVEYSTAELDILLSKRAEHDAPVERVKQKMYGAPDKVKYNAMKRHTLRQEAQRQLREWIQKWCEHCASKMNFDHVTTQNEFNRVFKIDVYRAQLLSERESLELLEKIKSNCSDLLNAETVV